MRLFYVIFASICVFCELDYCVVKTPLRLPALKTYLVRALFERNAVKKNAHKQFSVALVKYPLVNKRYPFGATAISNVQVCLFHFFFLR